MKSAGFSLVEVLVATAVVVAGVISVAHLIVVSARANRVASTVSSTLLLAQRKMEELIAADGLEPTPAGALSANTPGAVDFLDADGVSLGLAAAAPLPGTAYICRWSIEPLPASPVNAYVLQILVVPWPDMTGETRLVNVKARSAS